MNEPVDIQQPARLEGLNPQERLKDIYDKLVPTLVKVDITPEKNFQGNHNHTGSYNFIGVPGTFEYIWMGEGYISMAHTRKEGKDEHRTEYWLTEDGEGYFHDTVFSPKKFFGPKIHEDRVSSKRKTAKSEYPIRTNPILVLDRWSILSKMLTQSVEDPKNDSNEIRKQLSDFHTVLMDYFAKLGIVPEKQTVVYKGFGEEDLDRYGAEKIMPGLSKFIKEQEPAIMERARTYNDVQIPGTLGTWNIKFDEDLDPEDRAFMHLFEFLQKQAELHGLGVILEHKIDGQTTEVFKLWENGDASVYTVGSNGTIDETLPYTWKTDNPHLVKMKFVELRTVIEKARTSSQMASVK